MTREDWHTTEEGREALSSRYSRATIHIFQLTSGRFAIFNTAWDLCGIADSLDVWPPACWYPYVPKALPPPPPVNIDLHDLGLL